MDYPCHLSFCLWMPECKVYCISALYSALHWQTFAKGFYKARDATYLASRHLDSRREERIRATKPSQPSRRLK